MRKKLREMLCFKIYLITMSMFSPKASSVILIGTKTAKKIKRNSLVQFLARIRIKTLLKIS